MQNFSQVITTITAMLKKNNAKLFFAAQISICLACLAFAYLFEYIGFKPCPLCLYARIPYFLIALTSTIAIFASKYKNFLLYLIICIQGFSIGLAAYHSSIEFGWIAPMATCHSQTNFAFLSLAEMQSHIETENQQMPDCSKPSLLILGLSMAQLNFIFNSILIAISLKILKKSNKYA